jgi:hypothetical protein
MMFAWQKIVRCRNAAFLRRKPLIREVAPARARSEKLSAAAAPAARRWFATFTAMKRFVNSVSVVSHAEVAKDCRHAVGRLHVRNAVAGVRPPG